jgi:hypothetical protein
MRTKKPYKVITFHNTSSAMAMEKFCGTNNINGRLIPVPSEISAGCGLAWRITPEDFAMLEKHIAYEDEARQKAKILSGNFAIEIEQITLLELY